MEQSAPGQRIGTFGLMVSPLAPFPLSSPTRVSSSEQKPGLESRLLYTGHRMDSKQVSSMPLPKLGHHSGFDVIFGFSMLHQRFAYARPSRPEELHLEPLTGRVEVWRANRSRDHATFPAPSTSHAACGFPALRAPICFAPRLMGPIILGLLSFRRTAPDSR